MFNDNTQQCILHIVHCVLHQTWKKTFFFTQTCFEPQIFYLKKCVNYNKSNSRENSVKGPKDPNGAKNPNKKHNVLKCAKNDTKKPEIAILLTFSKKTA